MDDDPIDVSDLNESPTAEDMQDRFIVRIFTLADHAAALPESGKLYINGAGVDQVFMQQVPGPLPPLWLAIRVRVPWHMTSEPFLLQIRVLNADRKPIGPDPLIEANPELGRPPGLRPGDEIAMNVAVGLTGLPIPAEGSIYFHLVVAKQILGVLPLKVRRVPAFAASPAP